MRDGSCAQAWLRLEARVQQQARQLGRSRPAESIRAAPAAVPPRARRKPRAAAAAPPPRRVTTPPRPACACRARRRSCRRPACPATRCCGRRMPFSRCAPWRPRAARRRRRRGGPPGPAPPLPAPRPAHIEPTRLAAALVTGCAFGSASCCSQCGALHLPSGSRAAFAAPRCGRPSVRALPTPSTQARRAQASARCTRVWPHATAALARPAPGAPHRPAAAEAVSASGEHKPGGPAQRAQGAESTRAESTRRREHKAQSTRRREHKAQRAQGALSTRRR